MKLKIIILLILISTIPIVSAVADSSYVLDSVGNKIWSLVDGYSCQYPYCIYKPWYSATNIYIKNGSTQGIETSGTDITTVMDTILSKTSTTIFIDGKYIVSSRIDVISDNTRIICNPNSDYNFYLADGTGTSMFYVTSENFEISNCVINMNGANNAFPLNIEGAIYLVNANGTKIHDNNISSDNYPVGDDGSLIYADFTSYNNSIVNNILTGGRNNIFAYNYNIISGNIMSGGSHTCIYLRSGRYNVVTDNICEYASSGVGIEGDETSDAYGNVISNNAFYTMTGGSGVAIINTTGNSIIGNTCDQIQFNCIRITGSSNNTINSNTGNHMSKTTSSNQGGIYLINNSGVPSSNNTISSNTMIGPGQEYGILVANPTVNPGNKIFLNTIVSASVADYGGLTLGNQAYIYYNGTCFISSNDAGIACI